jgi:hypothetical protein
VAAAAVAVVLALVAVALAVLEPAGPPVVHVVRPSGAQPQLADASGRTLVLRGVAVTGLVDYPSDYAENPPVSAADFDEIAALGYDYVRLPVSWSLIEPRPGSFSSGYLGRVLSTVRAAERRGLRVLVDMHIDRYAKTLAPGDEADGAPGWATLTPARPCVPNLGSSACVTAAWESFWADRSVGGTGLQEHYIAALRALSRRVAGERDLLGLELMNNPSPGRFGSPEFEHRRLWPFWRKAIGALRDAGERRPLWLDRAASSERTDSEPGGRMTRFSNDANLVYAPHDYTGVFSSPAWPSGGTARLSSWYAGALHDASALHAPLVVGEYGSQAGGAWDQWLQAQLDLQDSLRVGSAFWMWKQRTGFYDWPVVRVDGSLRTDSSRAQVLSRPHPDAVPGRLLGFRFDGSALSLAVDGRGGVAVLWSGTQVVSGGSSALAAPLTRVTIDGRSVASQVEPKRFSAQGVSLLGGVVSVRVPSGRHTITLTA